MIKAIIFDMDGTILNTIDDITESVNHAFVLKGLKKHSIEAVKMAVGSGAYTLIERLATPDLSEEQKRELFSIYQAHYDKYSNVKTGPYDGIMDLLDTLKHQGYKLAVVSNKLEYLVHELNANIFHNYFDVSIGEVKGIPVKPAPDMLYKGLELLKVKKEEALFIGDSDVDMLTAYNAGLKSVGVTWGYRNQQTLIENHATYIIHKPSELLDVIERNQNK